MSIKRILNLESVLFIILVLLLIFIAALYNTQHVGEIDQPQNIKNTNTQLHTLCDEIAINQRSIILDEQNIKELTSRSVFQTPSEVRENKLHYDTLMQTMMEDQQRLNLNSIKYDATIHGLTIQQGLDANLPSNYNGCIV